MKKSNRKSLFSFLAVVQKCFLVVCLLVIGVTSSVSAQNSKDEFYRLNNEGNDYYSRHLFKRAAAEYSKMIAMFPNKVDGYVLRGMAYYRMGAYDKAIADDTKAIALQSSERYKAESYYNRGLNYGSKGDFPRAIADYTEAMKRYGPEHDSLENRAFSYAKIGKHALAVQDLTAALHIDPKKMMTYMDRCTSYIALKQYTKAVADARSATQLDPKSVYAWGALGWAQYLSGDAAGAIKTTQRARTLDSNAYWLCSNLGLFAAVRNDWASAKPFYTTNLTSATKSEIDGAVKDIGDALKMHPGNTALLQAKALLQSRAK